MVSDNASIPARTGTDLFLTSDEDSTRTIINLVEKHLEVWKETDPVKRLAVIQTIYTDNIRVIDPGAILTGYTEVSDFIGQLLQNNPGFVFRIAKPVEVHHHMAILSWQFGPLSKPYRISGQDVFSITDSRISSLLIFVDGATQ
jgi:hypothetical protein